MPTAMPTPAATATPKPDEVIVDNEIRMEKIPASNGSPKKVKASIHMYVPDESAQETTFILAVYKDNVLQSLKYIKETVIGNKQFEAEIEAEHGVTVKAMMWDGKQKPFVPAQRLEL